jgi:hypothetical protein
VEDEIRDRGDDPVADRELVARPTARVTDDRERERTRRVVGSKARFGGDAARRRP